MRGIRWLIVLFTLGLALLAGGIGGVAGSFADSEDLIGQQFPGLDLHAMAADHSSGL